MFNVLPHFLLSFLPLPLSPQVRKLQAHDPFRTSDICSFVCLGFSSDDCYEWQMGMTARIFPFPFHRCKRRL
jgi:hypothetical protein